MAVLVSHLERGPAKARRGQQVSGLLPFGELVEAVHLQTSYYVGLASGRPPNLHPINAAGPAEPDFLPDGRRAKASAGAGNAMNFPRLTVRHNDDFDARANG